MKLISMTNKVLCEQYGQQAEIDGKTLEEKYASNLRYANFLNRPLKLEMFVPVDDQGNVLSDPELTMSQGDGGVYYSATDEEFEQYQKAEDKVLFKDWILICENFHGGSLIAKNNEGKNQIDISDYRNIEELQRYLDLELTAAAQKQL